MESAMAIESEQQQQLLDLAQRLSPEQLDSALRYIRLLLLDPVWLSILTAPPDDEPYTGEQQRRDAEAIAAIERGEGIPHEEILREFGLGE
jgi:hypothetical protein